LFSAAELWFESERALEVALQLYRKSAGDFADCLHIALVGEAGERPLWTFDKGASSVDGAQLRGR
jgi:predicted nucleic-acid-binding protein